MLNRRQSIIWTNAVPIHWCIYAALGGDDSDSDSGLLKPRMANMLQTTFSNSLSWMTIVIFWLKLKFVPEGLIDNKSALVQAMAWYQIGTKSLPQPMMTKILFFYDVTRLHWVKLPEYQETCYWHTYVFYLKYPVFALKYLKIWITLREWINYLWYGINLDILKYSCTMFEKT